MHIEELKELEKRGMELMKILEDNKVKFSYDSGWGGYMIYEGDYEIVCKDENELEDYIEEYLGIFIIDEKCSSCHQHLTEYSYSPSIYFVGGEVEYTNEIFTGMTRDEMIEYENDIKNKYKDVDYVEFGEYCPYCLSHM